MLSPSQHLPSGYSWPSVREVFVQDAFQVGSGGPFELEFMFFEEAQSGPEVLRLIVKAPGGNKPVNDLLKVRSYDFAHG